MSDTEMADGTTTTTTTQPQRYFPIARSRRGSGLLWQGAGAPSTRSMSGSIPLVSRSNSGGSTSSTSASASLSTAGAGAGAPTSASIPKPPSSSTKPKPKSSAKPRSSGGGKGKQAVYASGLGPPTASASSVSTETTVKQSPPNSNTSRRSSLANLVHNLDMSDTEEVQQLAVLPGPPSNGVRVGFLHNAVVREDDDDDEDDDDEDDDEDVDEDGEQEGGGGDSGELEYIDADGGGDGGEGEGVVEVGEADDDEEDSSEDDESSDESEDEDDPNAVHSTESKPNSTVIPHQQATSINSLTNGVSPPSTNGQVPNAAPTAAAQASISVSTPSTPKPPGGQGGNGIPPPPSTGGSSALTSPPTSTPGPGYVQNALAQAIQAATASQSQSQSLPPPTTHTLPNASTTPVAESTTTPTGAGADPSSTATVKGPSKQPKGKGSKPKKHRTPSPSPPPPAPPPPITTIRLELKLGGPSNYEVDIARKAKETGQRAWSPEPPVVPVPEVVVDRADDGDGAGEGVGEGGGDIEGGGDEKGKKKRKKKSIAQEYYDTSDPFIDDSELAVDQRTYFAQTKQQGFYVSSGEVALLKDTSVKSPKKPKSKKNPLGGGSLSVATGMLGKGKAGGGAGGGGGVGANGDGTKDSPIALVDDDDATGHHVDSSSNTLYGVISKGIRGVGLVTSAGMIGHGAGAMKVDGTGVPVRDAFGGGMGVMNANPAATGSSGVGGGSVSAPPGGPGRVEVKMEMDDEGDERVGMKRKRYITVVEGGKKRKIVNINSFHPDLQAAIENLKQSIAKENWENKGKFPPNLKPQLAQLALLAIRLDEYDDHFFNLMPVLFPYNKFTMTKLIKRTVYPDHIALLQTRQDELLKQLEDLAKAGFTRAEEEYQKSLQQWSARQERERLKLEAGGAAGAGAGASAGLSAEASADGSAAPSRHPTEERDKDAMDVEGALPPQPPLSQAPGNDAQKDGGGGQQKKADHPPTRRYRLTEQMRGIIWDLVLLSNEACRLENEKNTFEGSMTQVSEQGGRKVLYQKIVSAFPEGWMSSGQISRDVSAMKKRFEKEAMEEA